MPTRNRVFGILQFLLEGLKDLMACDWVSSGHASAQEHYAHASMLIPSFDLQVVIFVKSVARAKELSRLLTECNFPAICIHSALGQEER